MRAARGWHYSESRVLRECTEPERARTPRYVTTNDVGGPKMSTARAQGGGTCQPAQPVRSRAARGTAGAYGTRETPPSEQRDEPKYVAKGGLPLAAPSTSSPLSLRTNEPTSAINEPTMSEEHDRAAPPPSEPSGTPRTGELPKHDGGLTTAPLTAEGARPDDMENPFDTSIGSGV